MCVSEICLKWIRVNQGLGVHGWCSSYGHPSSLPILNECLYGPTHGWPWRRANCIKVKTRVEVEGSIRVLEPRPNWASVSVFQTFQTFPILSSGPCSESSGNSANRVMIVRQRESDHHGSHQISWNKHGCFLWVFWSSLNEKLIYYQWITISK